MKRFLAVLLLFVASLCAYAQTKEPLIAFPGAEGYGRFSAGGRGGRAILVTNLNASGPGSLLEALDATGAREVVFQVSGTIDLAGKNLNIKNPYISVLGQTSPGGICIKNGTLLTGTHDVIIRGIRARAGSGVQGVRGFQAGKGSWNIIVDHCSFSWSRDAMVGTWDTVSAITIQNCLLAEALDIATPAQGEGPHSCALGPGPGENEGGSKYLTDASLIRNIIAHGTARNPKVHYQAEVVNNVVYNYVNMGAYISGYALCDFIGNYYKAGPNTTNTKTVQIDERLSFPELKVYVEGNWTRELPTGVGDQWAIVDGETSFRSMTRLVPSGYVPIPAPEAYEYVLANAGAVPRDAIDTRIVTEIMEGTGSVKATEGAYPVLTGTRTEAEYNALVAQYGSVGAWANSYFPGGEPEPPQPTVPEPPTNFVATATGQTSISLSWNSATDTDATTYSVYRSLSSAGPFTKVVSVPHPTKVYEDTGLSSSTEYWYHVKAANAVGESAPSNSQNVRTAAPEPPPSGALAFPGAEGFGRFSAGGRGGQVFLVTNLNSSGTGSLAAAIDATGPREVVFQVSGTIDLAGKNLNIKNPYISIYGQTSPGGICIKNGTLLTSTHDVIIRGIRARAGSDVQGVRGFQAGKGSWNVIVDHCSFSWSRDAMVGTWDTVSAITIQYCFLAEALDVADAAGGEGPHSFALGPGPGENESGSKYLTDASMIGNIIAHGTARNPKVHYEAEVANNLVYNYVNMGAYISGYAQCSMIGNYYKAGPNTGSTKTVKIDERLSFPELKIYLFDNWTRELPTGVGDQWAIVDGDIAHQSQTRLVSSGYVPLPGSQVFEHVLANAGAIPRDAVDSRVATEIREGTGSVKTVEGAYPVLTGTRTVEDYNALVAQYGSVEAWANSFFLTAPEEPSVPDPPTNFVAVASGRTSVSLSWNTDTDSDVTSYQIFRSLTEGGQYTKVANVSHPTNTYEDVGLTSGTEYWYYVKAGNSIGKSGPSEKQSVTTGGATDSPMAMGVGWTPGYGSEHTASVLIPTPRFSDVFGAGFGGTFGVFFDVGSYLRLTMSAGYLSARVKESGVQKLYQDAGGTGALTATGSVKAIPLLIGLQVLTPGPLRVYGGVEMGVYIYTLDITATLTDSSGTSTRSLSEEGRAELGMNFGLGVQLPLMDNISIAAGAKYHFVRASNFDSSTDGMLPLTMRTNQFLTFGIGVNWASPY